MTTANLPNPDAFRFFDIVEITGSPDFADSSFGNPIRADMPPASITADNPPL